MEADLTEEREKVVRSYIHIPLDTSSHLHAALTLTLNRAVCVHCAETILVQLIYYNHSLKQLRFEFKLQFVGQKIQDQAEESKNSYLVLL